MSVRVCVCILALVIRHANRIILRRLAVPYFSTLPHERRAFWGKKYWAQNVCLDFLYKVCLKHFSLSEEFCGILS